MTYTITLQSVSEPAEPFTSDDDDLSYGSSVGPTPLRRERLERRTLAQKLGLRRAARVVEERYYWSTGVSLGFQALVSYHGWSPSFEEAWDATGEVKRWWAEKHDRRPFVEKTRAELAERAARSAG